jgi:hypothetical protein
MNRFNFGYRNRATGPVLPVFMIIGATLGVMILAHPARADADPHRDTACPARQIGVTPDQFAQCFLPVMPARDHAPSGERQRANKAKLLPCLQRYNPSLTNAQLDRAMDNCRPEGPIHK